MVINLWQKSFICLAVATLLYKSLYLSQYKLTSLIQLGLQVWLTTILDNDCYEY